MKANMRELCIPLEEYAYEQEFACALLIGLLEPLYKKYALKIADEPASASGHASLEDALSTASLSSSTSADPAAAAADAEAQTRTEEQVAGGKSYGDAINSMVHGLWKALTAECDKKVKTKIDEKQKQVTARADAAQRLRVRAITTLVEQYVHMILRDACRYADRLLMIRDGLLCYVCRCSPDAEVTTLKPPTTPGDKRSA